MTSGRLPLCLGLIALIAALTQARAAPLDAETCTKLKGEQEQLELAGIEKEIAKGPAWAKALSPEKLDQVRRFIDVEAQLLFRCRNKALVHLPPDLEPPAPQADQGKGEAAPKDAAAPSPAAKAPKPDAKQKAKPKADKAGKDAAPAAKPADKPKKPEPGPAKKPAAKAAERQPAASPAKAKVDDAYKPPPPDPSVNPFAGKASSPAKE